MVTKSTEVIGAALIRHLNLGPKGESRYHFVAYLKGFLFFLILAEMTLKDSVLHSNS